MRVTTGSTEYEAVPLTPALALCRGGRMRPHLIHVDALFEAARPLPERRHGERRKPRMVDSAGRRRNDTVTLAADLELATLDRKLRERRLFREREA